MYSLWLAQIQPNPVNTDTEGVKEKVHIKLVEIRENVKVFFPQGQKGHTFSYKNPGYCHHSLIKIPNSKIFHNFTPLIRPLIRNLENQKPVTCQFH